MSATGNVLSQRERRVLECACGWGGSFTSTLVGGPFFDVRAVRSLLDHGLLRRVPGSLVVTSDGRAALRAAADKADQEEAARG